MSRKTVSVPKYRHHKGSGQAFVQVNGRRHYLGKWDSAKSKERYAAFVAELAIRPVTSDPLPPTTPAADLTVVELCAAYLDFAEVYYRKNGKPTTHLPQLKMAIIGSWFAVRRSGFDDVHRRSHTPASHLWWFRFGAAVCPARD